MDNQYNQFGNTMQTNNLNMNDIQTNSNPTNMDQTNISHNTNVLSNDITSKDNSDGQLENINELHLEMFKEKVKDWIHLDDDIKTLNNALKERKKKKNDLTPEILEFMEKFKIKDMNTETGKLKYSETVVKKPMNKEYIRKKLVDFLKNTQKADEATNFLLEQRETKVNIKLKRINNK